MSEKKSYSEEELNEMIAWFNNHANKLPKEMQINKAAFTPNLKLTLCWVTRSLKQYLLPSSFFHCHDMTLDFGVLAAMVHD